VKKLQALTSYLIENGLTKSATLDSWIESGVFKPASKMLGSDGVTILYFEYTAVLSLEKYTGNAALLGATIASWHFNNAGKDDGNEVEFSADKDESGSFEIEITIDFEEQINAMPDPNGQLMFNGQRYQLEDPKLWVAEEFEVTASVKDQ
jgi:hypothetical protein